MTSLRWKRPYTVQMGRAASMREDVKEFRYLIPSCVDEAIAMRRRHGEGARFIAGGTEIVPMMTRHKLEPDCLIELSRVDGLAVLSGQGGSLRIGAMATHAALERSPLTQGAWRALAEASSSIREPQVRNLGTVGGNLAYGVPSADLMPPLLVFDAGIKVKGAMGERLVPVSEFVVAPYRTSLNDGDILVEIELPDAREGLGSAFCKLTKFRGYGLTVASVAAALTLRDGRVSGARIAIGAVAPMARRVADAELFLEGRTPGADVLREAGRLVAAVAAPREASIRASPWYKRKVLASLTERALGLAADRSRECSGRAS
jgi:carbon-monoxide dehydrogenase medium subunit